MSTNKKHIMPWSYNGYAVTGVDSVVQHILCDIKRMANRGGLLIVWCMYVKWPGACGCMVGRGEGGGARMAEGGEKNLRGGGVGYEGVPHSAYTSPTKNFSLFTIFTIPPFYVIILSPFHYPILPPPSTINIRRMTKARPKHFHRQTRVWVISFLPNVTLQKSWGFSVFWPRS